MKRIQYKLIIPSTLAFVALVFACNKSFLDKPALGALSQATLANKTGVDGLLIGAYSMLDGEGGAAGTSWGSAESNWVFGSVDADDSYKGSTPSDQGDIVPLETWALSTSGNPYIEQKWQAVYDGAQRANEVLRVMRVATTLSSADTTQYRAEALFLRGHYHFEAIKVWGPKVPYVDENVSVVNNNTNVPNDHEIWSSVEADLQFAAANLPANYANVSPVPKGRANKYAAEALLAKLYMFEHKYSDAKPLLADIIANGKTATGAKYALGLYEANFNAATKNGPEGVFVCQMSVNDGSGTNGNYGDNLNFPNNGNAPGGCCGFNNPSWNLANAYKTDASGLPLLDTYNTGNTVSDPTTPYVGNLDSRIDWVMGRPGIPYFDLIHGGATWIRDPGTNGLFSPKKNVYANSQKGSLSSTETSFWGPTQMDANPYNFIRYADVLLWAAECEIQGGGTADNAVDFVNLVRARAADPVGWVNKTAYDAATGKYASGAPADTYKVGLYTHGDFDDAAFAMKAIRFERRLELAMEGHRFFDLQRWNSDTQNALDMSTVLNTYVATEKNRTSIYAVNTTATFTKGTNEIYPIPQAEIDIENSTGVKNLIQNPGYN